MNDPVAPTFDNVRDSLAGFQSTCQAFVEARGWALDYENYTWYHPDGRWCKKLSQAVSFEFEKAGEHLE